MSKTRKKDRHFMDDGVKRGKKSNPKNRNDIRDRRGGRGSWNWREELEDSD